MAQVEHHSPSLVRNLHFERRGRFSRKRSEEDTAEGDLVEGVLDQEAAFGQRKADLLRALRLAVLADLVDATERAGCKRALLKSRRRWHGYVDRATTFDVTW